MLRGYELHDGLIGMCDLEDKVRHGLKHLCHLRRGVRVHASVLLGVGEHRGVLMG